MKFSELFFKQKKTNNVMKTYVLGVPLGTTKTSDFTTKSGKPAIKIKFYFLGVQILKKIKAPHCTQVYILGLRVYKKNKDAPSGVSSTPYLGPCTSCEAVEKQILRLEGMKILIERENIKLGDNV